MGFGVVAILGMLSPETPLLFFLILAVQLLTYIVSYFHAPTAYFPMIFLFSHSHMTM